MNNDIVILYFWFTDIQKHGKELFQNLAPSIWKSFGTVAALIMVFSHYFPIFRNQNLFVSLLYFTFFNNDFLIQMDKDQESVN